MFTPSLANEKHVFGLGRLRVEGGGGGKKQQWWRGDNKFLVSIGQAIVESAGGRFPAREDGSDTGIVCFRNPGQCPDEAGR